MVQCSSCDRHFRSADTVCPFCSAPGFARSAMNLVGGAVTFVVLAACYGGPGGNPPPPPDTDDTDNPVSDQDGDGWATDEDCDDTNPAINPAVPEDCADGVDNDCDGLIDAADDDCP